MNAEQTIDTAKSLQRIQKYLKRLELTKVHHQECIHSFIDKDGAEIPLLATDLKAILQQVATTNPTQQGAADGFFLLLPQRPKPEAPAGTVGLDWDAYSGAQMLAFGRDSSDAAIAALRTEQPAPATEEEEDEGVSREQWVEQAMRVYLIAGDTEDEARECAEYQWGELDMDDLADPYDTAMSDIEGRGPAPATQPAAQGLDARDAARYRWLRDNDWRNDEKMEPVIRLHLNAIWDEKIDAAMAAQARNKKGIEQ